MRTMFLLLLTTSLGWAQTLHLEFAQQGDPKAPRALVVIHNSLESRDSLAEFFTQWADRNWARSQYCSVYSYSYTASDLQNLAVPEVLAKDLSAKIRANAFVTGEPDQANKYRTSEPADARQPKPTLQGDNLEVMFAGFGYGGLIAREAVLQTKASGLRVRRVAYLGAPLDGVSAIDLILSLTVRQRAQSVGLPEALPSQQLTLLGPGWWHLVELFDRERDWPNYFQSAYHEVTSTGGLGKIALPYHASDNVLYGKNQVVGGADPRGDGLLAAPLTRGKNNGPGTLLEETTFKDLPHHQLSEKAGPAILTSLVDKEITHDYLARREAIELAVAGKGDIEPIGVYWDERVPGYKNAYASPKGLYEMMWGVGL